MKDMETQMGTLDDFVTRARSQNAQHHDNHAQSLESLSTTVKSSYSNIGEHFTSTFERVREMGEEVSNQTESLQEGLTPLDEHLRQPLANLRSNIQRTVLQEYQPTGETPQKIQYSYPTDLPRTEAHETLLASLRKPSGFSAQSPSKSTTMVPVIFNDEKPSALRSSPDVEQRPTTSGSLRELDANISTIAVSGPSIEDLPQIPTFKRSVTAGGKLPSLRSGKKSVVAIEGRENTANLSSSLMGQQSTGRRRSPRNG
jgi:kinesin family member 11